MGFVVRNILAFFICLIFVFHSAHAQGKIQMKKEVYGVVFFESMFNNVAVNDANAAIKVYLNELQRKFKLGFDLKPIMFKNIEELIKSYSKENLAIVNLSAVDYLTYKSTLSVVPMFISTFKDTPFEEYLLLVKNDSKINSIASVSKLKIGMVSRENNPMTYMWFKLLLSQNKVTAREKILNNITEGKEDSQNIMSVFFGKLDACIVSKRAFQLMNELNPQIGTQLKVLASSPGFVISVSCFSKKFTMSPFQQDLNDAMLKVASYPAGQQLFTLMKTNRIIPFKEEYLDGVKKLLSDYNLLGDK